VRLAAFSRFAAPCAAGLGLECVSKGEIQHAFSTVPALDPRRVLANCLFLVRFAEHFTAAVARRSSISSSVRRRQDLNPPQQGDELVIWGAARIGDTRLEI
jgi:hypothetical protein